VLPDAPWRALAGGAARGIDLLVGHSRGEYSLFNARRSSDMTDEDVTATLALLAPALDGNGYRPAYPDAAPGRTV
jgi:para-nitrobenzyl esterase